MKEKILQTAFELYRRYGIKSISLDTVAQQLGVSKKTIYQHFATKETLVEAALEQFLEQVNCNTANPDENSVEALVETLRLKNEKVAAINVSFFYDLQKYHAAAHQKLTAYLAGTFRPFLIRNLRTGIAQGLYRPDLHPEIVADLCIATFSVVTDEDVFPAQQYPQPEVRLQAFKLFLLGILTPKGQVFLPAPAVEISRR